MLRENCKEFIRKLEQNQDNGLNTLKVNLDASGWYDMHDENADLSEALYKYCLCFVFVVTSLKSFGCSFLNVVSLLFVVLIDR